MANGMAKNMANGMAKNMAKNMAKTGNTHETSQMQERDGGSVKHNLNMAKTGNTYETSQMQELDVASAKHNLNMAKIGNTEERVGRYISKEISNYIRDRYLAQKIARM